MGFLGYMGKHLVQAVPFVYPLQCPAGKIDNTKMYLKLY